MNRPKRIFFIFPAVIAILAAVVIIFGKDFFRKPAQVLPPWYPLVNENGDPVFAAYENHIPCADCAKTKFALVLYRDKGNPATGTYALARVMVEKGNDRLVSEGRWVFGKGVQGYPDASVYELDANAPQEFRLFWKVSDDILFILDANKNPRAGDAAYGYVLNRTFPLPGEAVVPAPSGAPARTTLSGTYICLPHTDGSMTKECAVGIKTADNAYYSLDFNLLSEGPLNLSPGEPIKATGIITPIETLNTDFWRKYPVAGIFSVTDSVDVGQTF